MSDGLSDVQRSSGSEALSPEAFSLEATTAEATAASRWSQVCATAKRFRLLILIVLPIVVFLFSLTLGRYHVSLSEIAILLGSKLGLTDATVIEEVGTVILNVRLPRIFIAMLIGAGLSMAASYQGMFRNPLVSPDIWVHLPGRALEPLSAHVVKECDCYPILGHGIRTGGRASHLHPSRTAPARRSNALLSADWHPDRHRVQFVHFHTEDRCRSLRQAAGHYLLAHGESGGHQHDRRPDRPLPHGGRWLALLLVRWHLNPLSFGEEEALAMGADRDTTRGYHRWLYADDGFQQSAYPALSAGWG